MAAARRRPARKPPPIEHGILLTATLCLLAAGAVMVYSASSARDLLAGGGDGTAYLIRYVIYASLGLLAMRFLSRHGLEAVRQATPIILLVAFAGLLAVMLPGIGVSVNGARRWVGAGPLQFQPSELMKLALVLYSVQLLAAQPRRVHSLREMINPLLLIVGAACALVAVQPDLGTALVIAFTTGSVLIAAGVPLRYLGLIAGAAAFVVVVFAIMEPYRRARLTAFLNPWADASGSGFQSVQGQIALGSGGLLGQGLGQSVQKVFYLPEAHTDFVLAVIGEELGVVGICGLLFLYGMIAYAGFRVARTARSAYEKLLAAGITSLIVSQAALNTFTVLGLAPLTGVPLPFISYGSSNLLVLLGGMGLLLNVAAGGQAKLRAVPTRTSSDADSSRDRRRRDSRARRARAGGRRRAAG
ncbi:MAG: cell division protein FtsW [Solirubrobacteraceae bacterium]|jgi:cell division protein FtsW|nr:cell division protein FtsW [Solirubrobacteraceae bacterium]